MLSSQTKMLPLADAAFRSAFLRAKQKAPALHGRKNHAERTPLSLQIRHWICEKLCGSSLILMCIQANTVPSAEIGSGEDRKGAWQSDGKVFVNSMRRGAMRRIGPFWNVFASYPPENGAVSPLRGRRKNSDSGPACLAHALESHQSLKQHQPAGRRPTSTRPDI